MSVHFSESQQIRVPNPSHRPIPTTANGLAALQLPHTLPFHGYHPYMPGPYYGYPPFMHHQPPAQHSANDSHIMFLHAPCPQTPSTSHDNPASLPSSLLKMTLPHPVSLDQFCEAYEIDDDDKAGLLKLKFLLGDRRVTRLECEDWHGHAGFSWLSWDDFLQKHKQFILDVKSGMWTPMGPTLP